MFDFPHAIFQKTALLFTVHSVYVFGFLAAWKMNSLVLIVFDRFVFFCYAAQITNEMSSLTSSLRLMVGR